MAVQHVGQSTTHPHRDGNVLVAITDTRYRANNCVSGTYTSLYIQTLKSGLGRVKGAYGAEFKAVGRCRNFSGLPTTHIVLRPV